MLIIFCNLLVTNISFGQVAKLPTNKNELKAYLQGTWNGQTLNSPIRNCIMANYGNKVPDGMYMGEVQHESLTINFKQNNNTDTLNIECTDIIIHNLEGSEDNMGWQSGCVIVNNNTFYFFLPASDAKILCTLNEEGLYIKRFNLKLKRSL